MDAQEELEQRRKQLSAREDKPGFKANVIALKRRIAELEEQLNVRG